MVGSIIIISKVKMSSKNGTFLIDVVVDCL